MSSLSKRVSAMGILLQRSSSGQPHRLSPKVEPIVEARLEITPDNSDRHAVAEAIAALPDLSYPNALVATETVCLSTSIVFDGVESRNRQHGNIAESPQKTGESALSDEKLKPGLLAELADALDSKSNARKGVSVRLR
jgi:hypothetical protein